MMVSETTDTRVWTCPICTDEIEVHLTWRQRDVGLIRVLHVDDVDARLHMAWHSMCTCQWEHDTSVNPEQPVVTRQQGLDCPMHP